MLVLKRKIGETIKIGDDIEVQILGIEGDVVKLGFNAPRHVQIMRSELYDAIRNENLQATMQTASPEQLLSLMAKKPKEDK
ncbi:hypothetical protein D3C80_1685030 [compost metagenome]